ncbi:uncharacterized protein LOC106658030 [Trichogramma pretiosum]|uniref:uncharacterized protein LOC106658030 n=1 Tax=Trichogramma pretiosum TaxID=7493 RepID=UPI0006C94916|nr:uncharacterized protein LOC106658030 [Trichogramma pretiosum]XP_023316901.1 uncharacterized protein LOC106658030 [Trichogramma pretiosum]XP_023316902.1 uncharacterized protein LOC106658030 [Trichogramma pretiosum]
MKTMTDMCSREPAPSVLQHHHSVLGKSNGKNSSNSSHQQITQSTQINLQHQGHSQPRPSSSDSKIHGNNGHDDDSGHINGANINNTPTPGGRLKFFKDGKFILELSHRRDGERTTWFPVPKKTFWPPASVTPNRQESSASLSVSDDNSSIQSSPWQRDHCWKQSSPRRNISTEFTFYYRRYPKTQVSVHPRLIARKRRQPFDSSSSITQLKESIAVNQQKAVIISAPSKPSVKLNQVRKLNGAPANKSLNIIIDKLARLLDPNVVSPRKRILRELERVSLEDQASKRRATPPHTSNNSMVLNVVNEPTVSSNRMPTVSIAMAATTSVPATKQLSSYSITSILGEDKPSVEGEPGFLRNLLKPQIQQPQIHRSPQPHCSPQPHRSPQPHQSPQPHHSPQHQPVYGRSSRIDPGMAYLNSSNVSMQPQHPPIYGLPLLPPAAYRTSPFCWMHYSQPMHYPPPMLYTTPPQPQNHSSSPSPPAHRFKDYREQTLTPPSDVPLNLSKHAG